MGWRPVSRPALISDGLGAREADLRRPRPTRLGPGGVARTAASMLDLYMAFIAFDFDADGKVLGIEILAASRVLTAEALRAADR